MALAVFLGSAAVASAGQLDALARLKHAEAQQREAAAWTTRIPSRAATSRASPASTTTRGWCRSSRRAPPTPTSASARNAAAGLARRPDTPAELLTRLVRDELPRVRAAVLEGLAEECRPQAPQVVTAAAARAELVALGGGAFPPIP
jgi:hypothetical protein